MDLYLVKGTDGHSKSEVGNVGQEEMWRPFLHENSCFHFPSVEHLFSSCGQFLNT
jgi:hypothetical protein